MIMAQEISNASKPSPFRPFACFFATVDCLHFLSHFLFEYKENLGIEAKMKILHIRALADFFLAESNPFGFCMNHRLLCEDVFFLVLKVFFKSLVYITSFRFYCTALRNPIKMRYRVDSRDCAIKSIVLFQEQICTS